nr:DUF3226 domain-containing protein [Ferrimicrobium acidiphilum]
MEGTDDMYAVINLMKGHVPWPDNDRPVTVKVLGGSSNILNPSNISTHIKESGLKTLGIMLDADTDCFARWQSVHGACLPHFPNMPALLPRDGLVIDYNGKRLGVWIMPDNNSNGMLETFLPMLIPSTDTVWGHAQASVTEAKNLGAPFGALDVDKANIHTWLAWQKSPGRPFGTALTEKILDPGAPDAHLFVQWFCRLYDICSPTV